MKRNPPGELQSLGQSIWIDFISRRIISSGKLQRLVEEDGVSGVTSNPSIFEKAISETDDYDDEIQQLTLRGKSADEIYELLTVEDIQMTADLLYPVYQQTDGRDGFVSLEVSPRLAHDTRGTIEEAHRLWSLVDRPNMMIKVPATQAGLPAIRQLTAQGINVNITLLFGLARYREVVSAFLEGLESLAAAGKDLRQVASVASFFLSRIDLLVDPFLEQTLRGGGPQAEIAARWHGQVAIASAKIAYQIYKETFSSDRFLRLAERGARIQRLLWASTSSKNPGDPDTKYIEPLIGPQTINTMPLETLAAYRDHGRPAQRLEENISRAYHMPGDLAFLGIDLDAVAQDLEEQGVQKFGAALNRLMKSLREKQAAVQPVS